MVMPFLALDRTPSAYVPQSLYIPIHFSMAHRIVGSRHLHHPQAATPAATRQRIVRQHCAFPKVNQIFIFVHRNILFRSDKTFWIHIFIRFWEFRWLNFSSYSVMCFRSRSLFFFTLIFCFFFFYFGAAARLLSEFVCMLFLLSVVCYRDHTLSLSELKFLLFIKFFFSSSSSHSHSALSATAVFVWCVCVHEWNCVHG